ncbi:MAG: MBL fold metallo-hydrolase [Mycoplasma sp.]|nr:MBL fold metallo-hydrolase [Candidatus Hennigella equi]
MSKSLIEPNLVVISSRYMDNNSYIIFNKKEAIVIDPSFSGNEIIDNINNDIKVVGVLLTHAHFDHCLDTAMIVDKWHCPVYVHEGDKDTYFKYRYDELADMKVKDFAKSIKWFNTKKLSIGSFELNVMHTPGHSAGSVVYQYNNWFFVGDTLFYNSYGRTDLGNSSPIDMIKSLNRLWKELKDNNLILPGHNKWGLFKEVKQANWMVQDIIKK